MVPLGRGFSQKRKPRQWVGRAKWVMGGIVSKRDRPFVACLGLLRKGYN
jgi:hypothetical protein